MPGSVFVSGANGFIAQHICKLLLLSGYAVVGSVRTLEKGERLKKLFTSQNFSYEIVSDVEPVGAFGLALENHPEVTAFIHTASPFHFQSKNPEEEMLKPAVNGTVNVLKTIRAKAPQISKVILTSSYAAIADAASATDPDHTNTEDSWNGITWEQAKKDPQSAYRGSKTFAEKAAWEFMAAEKPPFSLTVINPVLVTGPQAFDSEVKEVLNTSAEFINGILKSGGDGPIPPFNVGYIDVRDVAKAHVLAVEKDFSTQRLFLVNGSITGQDITDILNENFPVLKGKIPVGKPGSSKGMAKSCKMENTRTRELLGFPFIDAKMSVVDSVTQILKVKGVIS